MKIDYLLMLGSSGLANSHEILGASSVLSLANFVPAKLYTASFQSSIKLHQDKYDPKH